MSWKTSLQRPIRTPKQLLVEGRTPEIFFRQWIETTELKGKLEVRDFGAIENLTSYLKVFCQERLFREQVTTLGIIRDAESHPATDAFQSVCTSLEAAGLTRPTVLGAFSNGVPQTGVYILPDCDQPGMLETLCWQVLQANPDVKPQVDCVTDYLDCMRKNTPIRNEAKAKVWAYLAGRGEFDPLVGRAAQANVWNWTSPALTKLSTFLNSL